MSITMTSTSYLVLGLVASTEGITPYEMKATVNGSLGHIWPFPHSQLYAEPVRLAGAGLLEERQEQGGRRRKRYYSTELGRRVLQRWFRLRSDEGTELRDPALLKLFFGALAEPGAVVDNAEFQVELHREQRKRYEALLDEIEERATPHQLATLEIALRYERMAERFWRDVAAHPPS